MRRAIWLAFSRSLVAPLEISPKTISSASVPPRSTLIRLSSSDLRDQVAVLLRPMQDVAQGADAARNDRHLVDDVRVGQRAGHHGMARFVIGDPLLLLGRHDPALAFQADRAAFDGLVEVEHADGIAAVAGGDQGGLVDDVGQVGADRAGRQARRRVADRRRRPA